jgi:hypothetical protein
MKWRLVGLSVLPVVAACARTGGLLGPAPWPGPLPATRELHGAVAAAHARFDTLAGRGDATALATLFTPDAIVVAGPDTLRGFTAVAAYFTFSRPSATDGSIEFRPNRTDLCADGAVEIGGSLMLVTRLRSGTADTLQPAYAVRWVSGPSGPARIRYASVQPQAYRPAPAVPRCDPYLHEAMLSRRPLRLSVYAPFSVAHWNLQGAFGSMAAGRGYAVRTYLICGGGGRCAANIQPEASGATVAAGIRVRVAGFLSAEAYATPFPHEETIPVQNATASTLVVLRYAGRVAALLVGVEHRALRVSAGPALVFSKWSLVGSDAAPHAPDMERATSLGWMAQAVYTYAIGRGWFGELGASWRAAHVETTRNTFIWVPGSALPPSPTWAPSRLDLGGWSLGIAMGVAP